MTDQDTPPGQQSRPDGVTESELDQQRLGEGLGDTIDGKNVADLGRPDAEPRRVGGLVSAGVQPRQSGATDAGDVEDLGPDEGGPDDIEAQDATSSGSSGL